jgi:hypothetical protein
MFDLETLASLERGLKQIAGGPAQASVGAK